MVIKTVVRTAPLGPSQARMPVRDYDVGPLVGLLRPGIPMHAGVVIDPLKNKSKTSWSFTNLSKRNWSSRLGPNEFH